MFEPRIKVPRRLFENLEKLAKTQGYSSPNECAIHILEAAVETSDTKDTDAAIKERLKGLGYLE